MGLHREHSLGTADLDRMNPHLSLDSASLGRFWAVCSHILFSRMPHGLLGRMPKGLCSQESTASLSMISKCRFRSSGLVQGLG